MTREARRRGPAQVPGPGARPGEHGVPQPALAALQTVADRSAPTRVLARLQATAATRAGGALQRKEPRSRNPYNPHTGVTSHHIIPHELLGTLLDKFKGRQDVPDERAEVMRGFLPAFDQLTLANFVAVNSVKVTYDGASPNKVTELPEAVATTPFGSLSDEDKGKTRFAVEDAGQVDFAGFARLYGQLLNGETVTTPDGEEVSGLRDLGEAFFEWQGGNLFYGPERIEPGAKDGFDFDAALIYGESYANQLAAIYTQLRALEKKNDPGSKAEIRRLLGQMSALTKGVGAPKHDPAIWHQIANDTAKTLHDILLPERTKTSKVGASIHVKVLRGAIRSYCAKNAPFVFKYMGRTQDKSDGLSSADDIVEAKRSRMWLKAAPSVQQDVLKPRKIATVQSAMAGLIETAFGL